MKPKYEISNKEIINKVLENTEKMKLNDAIEEAKKLKMLERKDVESGWIAGFRKYAIVFKEAEETYVRKRT